MKYYLIAGEASGDLHASHLMHALRKQDGEAQFRFFGGDLMKEAGGTCVQHYKEIAYMGFIPVLMHARTILKAIDRCREDVLRYRPDCLILIDYPGFNLKIARYIKQHSSIPVYYYISPKIWAWKEHRIKAIKRDIDGLFSILPFEVEFFRKHQYPIVYTGNPTAAEVQAFRETYKEDAAAFRKRHNLPEQPVIALLAGSRKQELKDNLTRMLEAARRLPQYQCIVAGAPGLSPEDYAPYLQGESIRILYGETYPLLTHATAAMVTSGTATLETALLDCPQVVCYYIPCAPIFKLLRKWLLKVRYISLVNLIAGREVVTELVADEANPTAIARELESLLPGERRREKVLQGYMEVKKALGDSDSAHTTAQEIIGRLRE